MTQQALIQQLSKMVQQHIQEVEKFQSLDKTQLNYRQAEGKWSILECLEHLNLYGDFYLTEIEQRILARPSANASKKTFQSGWLGNYFATSMLPPEDGSKMKTMKTFKDKEPSDGSELPISTINRFLEQQKQMLHLLEIAKKADLNKVRTNITILKGIVRLKLGDTFRFVMNHNERHIIQAKKVLMGMTKI